jgi:hypothetical protein
LFTGRCELATLDEVRAKCELPNILCEAIDEVRAKCELPNILCEAKNVEFFETIREGAYVIFAVQRLQWEFSWREDSFL